MDYNKENANKKIKNKKKSKNVNELFQLSSNKCALRLSVCVQVGRRPDGTCKVKPPAVVAERRLKPSESTGQLPPSGSCTASHSGEKRERKMCPALFFLFTHTFSTFSFVLFPRSQYGTRSSFFFFGGRGLDAMCCLCHRP